MTMINDAEGARWQSFYHSDHICAECAAVLHLARVNLLNYALKMSRNITKYIFS